MLSLGLLAVLSLSPQEELLHNGVRSLSCPVPGSGSQAFALLMPVGFDHDPLGAAGLAEAAALCLLAQAAPELPPGATARHSVQGTCTLFQCTVDAAHADAGLRWCALLLRSLQDDPDRMAMALAQAALLADNAEEVFPGPMLQSRLRRALWSGTPLGRWQSGKASELQAVDQQRLREFVAQTRGPERALLVSIGGADRAMLRRGMEVLAAVPKRGVPPQPVLRQATADAGEATTNWRTGGAFIAVALRAPLQGDAHLLPFALGIEVLRLRALRAFQEHRGGEAGAGAPFVLYDLLAGDPLAVVCRRGKNGIPAEGPRGEIEELLEHLRRVPPGARELEAARTALQGELMVPPFPGDFLQAMVAAPSIMATRARAWALLAHRGLLGRVHEELPASAAAVATALGNALLPENLVWHAILPAQPGGR